MQYVLLAAVATSFAVGCGVVWLRRRREAPLRLQIRSQEVTFRMTLSEVKVEQPGVWPRWLALNSFMALFVRGDGIEISSTIPPVRVVAGMEYYFKANETFIGVSQAPSMVSKKNWIIVTGRHDGKEIKLAITNGIEGQLYDTWNALAAPALSRSGHPQRVRLSQ